MTDDPKITVTSSSFELTEEETCRLVGREQTRLSDETHIIAFQGTIGMDDTLRLLFSTLLLDGDCGLRFQRVTDGGTTDVEFIAATEERVWLAVGVRR